MEAPCRGDPVRGGLQFFDKFLGECRREYITLDVGSDTPGEPCSQSALVIFVALQLRCECRWDYSLQRSWSRVRILPGPPWTCSSAVEHETSHHLRRSIFSGVNAVRTPGRAPGREAGRSLVRHQPAGRPVVAQHIVLAFSSLLLLCHECPWDYMNRDIPVQIRAQLRLRSSTPERATGRKTVISPLRRGVPSRANADRTTSNASDRHLVAHVHSHECHSRLHGSPVRLRPGHQACSSVGRAVSTLRVVSVAVISSWLPPRSRTMIEPSDDSVAGSGPCALCHRQVCERTKHHLIPRSRRDARRRRVDPDRAEAERQTVALCRPCHCHLHQVISERELARSCANLPGLASHPDVAAFTQWVARRPDGVKIPSAAKKRR